MAEYREAGIVHCLEHPGRHCRLVHLELRVNRAHDIVESVEELVTVIEIARGEYVAFDSFQNSESLHSAVEVVYLIVLAENLVALEAARIEGSLGMIGDADVLPSAIHCSLRHLLDRRAAVGVGRMTVQSAPDVFARDEVGECSARRRFDFAEPFAELGRNVVEPERLEEITFGLELYGAALWINELRLFERKSPRFRKARELNDMISASGCAPQCDRCLGL